MTLKLNYKRKKFKKSKKKIRVDKKLKKKIVIKAN